MSPALPGRADPALLVDGRTPFVAVGRLFDEFGVPLDGRTAELALVEDELAELPISPALEGFGVGQGGGSYVKVFTPRVLSAHLAPYAGRVVLLRVQAPGVPPSFTRYRVQWRAAGGAG